MTDIVGGQKLHKAAMDAPHCGYSVNLYEIEGRWLIRSSFAENNKKYKINAQSFYVKSAANEKLYFKPQENSLQHAKNIVQIHTALLMADRQAGIFVAPGLLFNDRSPSADNRIGLAGRGCDRPRVRRHSCEWERHIGRIF
jgi:hypothetical protein